MILRRLRGIGGQGEMRSLFDAQVVALAIIVIALFGSFVLIASSEQPQETVAQVRYGVATTLVSVVDLPSTIVSYLERLTTVGQAGAAAKPAKPGGLQQALSGGFGGPGGMAVGGGVQLQPGMPPMAVGGGGPPKPPPVLPPGKCTDALRASKRCVGNAWVNGCNEQKGNCPDDKKCVVRGGTWACEPKDKQPKQPCPRDANDERLKAKLNKGPVCTDGCLKPKKTCKEFELCYWKGDTPMCKCGPIGKANIKCLDGKTTINVCDETDSKKPCAEGQVCEKVGEKVGKCICDPLLANKNACDPANPLIVVNSCKPPEKKKDCDKINDIQRICNPTKNPVDCDCPPAAKVPFKCDQINPKLVMDKCDNEFEDCEKRGIRWTCKQLTQKAECQCPASAADERFCSTDGKTEQAPGTMIIDGCAKLIQQCTPQQECRKELTGPKCVCKDDKKRCSQDHRSIVDGCGFNKPCEVGDEEAGTPDQVCVDVCENGEPCCRAPPPQPCTPSKACMPDYNLKWGAWPNGCPAGTPMPPGTTVTCSCPNYYKKDDPSKQQGACICEDDAPISCSPDLSATLNVCDEEKKCPANTACKMVGGVPQCVDCSDAVKNDPAKWTCVGGNTWAHNTCGLEMPCLLGYCAGQVWPTCALTFPGTTTGGTTEGTTTDGTTDGTTSGGTTSGTTSGTTTGTTSGGTTDGTTDGTCIAQSDSAFCPGKCGDVPDPNCAGVVHHCSTTCPQGKTCNQATHKCECTSTAATACKDGVQPINACGDNAGAECPWRCVKIGTEVKCCSRTDDEKPKNCISSTQLQNGCGEIEPCNAPNTCINSHWGGKCCTPQERSTPYECVPGQPAQIRNQCGEQATCPDGRICQGPVGQAQCVLPTGGTTGGTPGDTAGGTTDGTTSGTPPECQGKCGILTVGANTYNCGNCPTSDQVCKNNACCLPQTCTQIGKECGGPYTEPTCGEKINCPACPNGPCKSDGKCCTKESDAEFCARFSPAKECGSASGTDNCGEPRTVQSCGTCPTTRKVCKSDGTCCKPKTCDTDYPLQCGSFDDGCSGSITCGCPSCSDGSSMVCDAATKKCDAPSDKKNVPKMCLDNTPANICSQKIGSPCGEYKCQEWTAGVKCYCGDTAAPCPPDKPTCYNDQCMPNCGNGKLDEGEMCDASVQQCAPCDSIGGTNGGWDPGAPGMAVWFSPRPAPGSSFSLLWDIVSPFFNFFGTNLGRAIASPCGVNEKFCNACQWDTSECLIDTGGTTGSTTTGCTVSSTNCASYPCGGMGEDNCGNSVSCPNTCSAGQNCYNGQCCSPQYPSDACGSQECGTASDGCGGTVQCGAYSGGCPSGRTCNSGKCEGCGNGRKEGSEECDDGNTVNTDACTNTCKNAKCGDSYKQSPEECDDGNTVNTDACTTACKNAKCGDAYKQGTEECDDGNTVNTDACTTACKNARCGDGIVRAGSEQCDGGSQSCTAAGGYTGTQTCASNCVWNACSSTQRCGDAIKNGQEACDWAASTSQCPTGYACSNTCACSVQANSPCGIYGLAHGQQQAGTNQWCCNGQLVFNQNFNDCRVQPGLCFGQCVYNGGSGCPGTASCIGCQGIMVNGVCCTSGITLVCANGVTQCCNAGQLCYCTGGGTTSTGSTTTTYGGTTYGIGGSYYAPAVSTETAAQQASLEVVTGLAVAEPAISLVVGQTFVSSNAIVMCEHDTAFPDPSKTLVMLMRGDSVGTPEGTVVCRAQSVSGGISSVGRGGFFSIFNIATVGRAGETGEPSTGGDTGSETGPDYNTDVGGSFTTVTPLPYPPDYETDAPIPNTDPKPTPIYFINGYKPCVFVLTDMRVVVEQGEEQPRLSDMLYAFQQNPLDSYVGDFGYLDDFAQCYNIYTGLWEVDYCGGENGDQPFNRDTGLYDPPCPYGCDKETGDCNSAPVEKTCGNGEIDQSFEECEKDKATFTWPIQPCVEEETGYKGVLTCSGCIWPSSCAPLERCGDGKKNGKEVCDTLVPSDVDCATQTGGQKPYGIVRCARDCKSYDSSGCFPSKCGNDIIEAGEDCELQPQPDGSAKEKWPGSMRPECYPGEGVADPTKQVVRCLNCKKDEQCCSQPSLPGCGGKAEMPCGNGKVDAGEDCDKGNPLKGIQPVLPKTCVSLLGDDYQGTLACDANCHYDTKGCSHFSGEPRDPTDCPPKDASEGEQLPPPLDVVTKVCSSKYPGVLEHRQKSDGKTVLYCEQCKGSCENDKCKDGSDGTFDPPCSTECATGETCEEGACTKKPCASDADCPDGTECKSGECVKKCVPAPIDIASFCQQNLPQGMQCGKVGGVDSCGGPVSVDCNCPAGKDCISGACTTPVSEEKCGNNKIDTDTSPPETCDGTDLAGKSCETVLNDGKQYEPGGLRCASNCQSFITTSCTEKSVPVDTSSCGNNKKEGTEKCDGTDLAGQTCSALTDAKKPFGTPSCYGGSADAAVRCTFNIEGCKECEKNSDCPQGKVCSSGGCGDGPTYGETYCGDGTIQPQNGEGGTEQCETPNKVGDMTCKKYKPNMYTGGTMLCKRSGKDCVFDDSRCDFESPPETQQCGNNKKEASESCDGTDLDGKTCRSVTLFLNPALPKGALSCYPQGNAKECQFNLDDCKECESDTDCSSDKRCVNYRCAKKTYCGDGTIQAKNDEGGTENCEINLFSGPVLDGYDCSTVDAKFTGGKLGCKRVAANCVFDTSGCTSDATTCGNSKREDPEQCDGNDFGSATCASATGNTLRFGFLQCVPKGGSGGKSGCTLDTSMCKECEKDPDCSQSPVKQQCFMGKCEKKTYCGDGVRQNINDDQQQEKCDGNDLDSKTCEDFIKDSRGALACTSSCEFDTSGCKKKCGDGVIQNPNDDKVAEECETKDGAPVFTDSSYAACNSHSNPPNNKGSVGTVGCSSCKYDFSSCKPDLKKDCDKYRYVCKNKDGSTTPSSSGQYAGKNIFVPSKEPGGPEKTWDSPAVWRLQVYPDCPQKSVDTVPHEYCAFGCVQKSADEASCCPAPPAPSCKAGTKTRIIPLYCGQVKEEQCKNACKGGVCINLPNGISFGDSFTPSDFTTSTEPDGSTTITFTGSDGSTTTITTKPGTSITINSPSDVTVTSTASDEEQRRWAEGVSAYKKAFARDLGVWVRATADAARIEAAEKGAAREAARKAAIEEYAKRIDALRQQISSASGDEKARLQDELKGLQTNKALLESRTDDFKSVANNLKTDLLKHYTSGFDGGDSTPLFDSYLQQQGLKPPTIDDPGKRGELSAQMGVLESMAKSYGKKTGEEKAATPDHEAFVRLVNAITDYIRTAYGPGGNRRPYADGVDNFIGRNGGVTKATIKKGGRTIDIKHVPSIRDDQNPNGKRPTIGGTIIQQNPSTGTAPDFSPVDIHIRTGPQDMHTDYRVGTSITVDTKPYDGNPSYNYDGEFSRKVQWKMESSNGCYKLRATLSLHELLERLPYENKLAELLNKDTIRQQIEKHPIEIVVESCGGKFSIDFKFPDFESAGFADLISGGLKKAFMDMFRSNADSFLDVLDDLPGLKSGMKEQLKAKFASTLKALLGTDVKRLTTLDSIHLEMTDMPSSSPGGVPAEMQVQVTVSGKTDSGIATSFTGTGVADPKLPPTGGDITSAALAYLEALMKGYLEPQSQTPQTGTMARDIFNFLGLWYGWMYNGGLSPGDAIDKIVPPAGKPQETVSPSVGDVGAKVTKPGKPGTLWGWESRPEFGASMSVQLTGPDGTSILPTPFEVKIESSQTSAKITIKIPPDGKGGDSIRRAFKHALETGDLSLLDKIFDGAAGGMGADKAQWFKNALKDSVDALRKNGGINSLDSMSELSLRLSEDGKGGMNVALDVTGKGSDGKDVSASSGNVQEPLGDKWPVGSWASGAWDYFTSDNPMIKAYKEGSSAGRWAPGFDPSADTPTRMLNTLMGFIEGLLGSRNNVKPYAPGDLPGVFKGETPAAPTSKVEPQKSSFNDGSVGVEGSAALASFRSSAATSQYVGLSLPEGQSATLTKEVTLANPITDDLYIGTPTTLEFRVKTQGGVPQVTPSESTVQTLADVTNTESFIVTDKDTSFAVSGSGRLPGVGPLAAPPAQVTYLMLATYGLVLQTAAVMSPAYLVPASDVYRKDETTSYGPKDLTSEYKLAQEQAQKKPSTNPCAEKLKLAALKYAEYHKKIIGPLLQQAMEQAKALRDPNSPKSAFDAAVDAFAKGQSGFDKAIEATQRFLTENGGTSSPIAPQLSAQLAELQAAKAGAIMPENPGLKDGFFHVPETDPETEPLMYRTRMEYDDAKGDFVEKVKEWSPDGVNFMPTSQTTVKGGTYDGKKPTAENQQLISRIEQSGGDMSLLRAEREARLSQGATDKYPVTNSRAAVSESYRRAVKALDEARKRFEEARELAKNMITECDKYHGELLDAYDALRKAGDPGRESLSPSISAAGVATQEMRDLLVSSHQSAAMMYQHMGKNDKARESLLRLIDTTGSKVEGYIGLAMIDMAEGDLKEALVSVNKALDYEPGDPQALAMKRVLEAAFTSVVRKAIATERDQLVSEFQGKVGAELDSWSDKIKASFRTGIGKSGLAFTSYFDNLASVASNTQKELGYQQFGTLLIEHLLKLSANDIRTAFGTDSGLENLDLKDIEQFTSSDLDKENRLAKIMGLPIEDSDPAVRDQAVRTLAEMRRALIAAYSNPDIQTLKDYRGSQLQLESGTGYKDHSAVESNWRDWALDAVNAENVFLILAPGAKVGSAWSSIGLQYWRGARYLGIGAELSTIQKAPTLAAWLLSGLFRAGQGVIGAERSAQLAESYGTISKAVTQTMDSTMGSSSVGRLLTAQIGTGLVARGTFGALKFVASEAIESVIGYGVGSLAGGLSPEIGDFVSSFVEASIGSSGVIDDALGTLGKAGRNSRHFILGEGGKVLGELIDVESVAARQALIDQLRKSAAAKGLNFEDLGSGQVRVGSAHYKIQEPGDRLPSSLAGQEVKGGLAVSLKTPPPAPLNTIDAGKVPPPGADSSLAPLSDSNMVRLQRVYDYRAAPWGQKPSELMTKPLGEGGLAVGKGRPEAIYVYELKRTGDSVTVKVTRAGTHGNTRGVIYEATHSASEFPFLKNGESFAHALAQHTGADLELNPPVIDVPKPPVSPAPLPEGFSSEAQLESAADTISRNKLGKSLDELVNDLGRTSGKSLDNFANGVDAKIQFLKSKDLESMTDDDIIALSEAYRRKLISSGVAEERSLMNSQISPEPVSDKGNDFNVARYRSDLFRRGGFFDYVEELDNQFSAGTKKVFLGTDGIEYTRPAYDASTIHDGPPNSQQYFINRIMLATEEELMRIRQRIAMGESIEALQQVNAGNIGLYMDMDTAVTSAANSVRKGVNLDGSPTQGFEDELRKQFNFIMQNAANRRKIVELVNDFRKSVDLREPMVLVDVAGRVHTQPFALQKGVEWVGKNWDSLTPAEKALLGSDGNLFKNAKIDRHLGVSPIVHPANPLQGFDIEGIVSVEGAGDIVEVARSMRIDEGALLDGRKEFLPTPAIDQSQTLLQQLIMIQELQLHASPVAP